MTEEACNHVPMTEGQTAFCTLHFYSPFPTISAISLRSPTTILFLHATVDAFHEPFEPLSMHFFFFEKEKEKKKRKLCVCDLEHVTLRCCILPDNKDLSQRRWCSEDCFIRSSNAGGRRTREPARRRERPGRGRVWRVFARSALNPAYFNLAGDKSENG